MKTQISRNSFDPLKRYSGVYQQMGRMFTDADWNESSDLIRARLADALTDVIGSGTPGRRGLVKITENPDDTRSYDLVWGYVYVDGIIAQVRPDEAEAQANPDAVAFKYDKQADFPVAPPTPGEDHKLYVDVWERTVTFLEDHDLRDPGLHGADTCTRTQTMARVKWCPPAVDPEDAAQNPPIGDALLTLKLSQGSTEPDPCDPCAEELALHDKVGNYLFRVELHDVEYDAGGAPKKVEIKWSRENGAEQYPVGDNPPGFVSDDWVYESFSGTDQDFASEKHLGKHLATGFIPERGKITRLYPDAPPAVHAFVRRWDGHCVLKKSGSNWILEGGSDRADDLSKDSAASAHGHVKEGAIVTIKLDAIDLTIKLADRPLLAGDFWLATVRQSVDVVGKVILSEAQPRGILHHYMTLGPVAGGTFTADSGAHCRRFDFPPLTDLRADDVCYENSACHMPEVVTVQDAIDHLCQERDLRWHNKHLHGWGIVCGLIVECGPDTQPDPNDLDAEPERQQVRLTKGYALDCEGNDITLDNPKVMDLMRRIKAFEERTGKRVIVEGEGSVCLTLDRDGEGHPTIGVERYDASGHGFSALLEDTLWTEFYEDCILDLVVAIKDEVQFLDIDEVERIEEAKGALVSVQRRKFTSILNLAWQLINRSHGQYVFLSLKEHKILRAFYFRLRKLLQSHTFCAMFQDKDFPNYPWGERLARTTYFGKNNHTRIKTHPSGRLVYTYGGVENTINVYDVEKGELVEVIEMPSAEGAEVSAIAFSSNGDLLYAAANIRGVDSVFGIARVDVGDHQWEKMAVLCNIDITEMEISAKDSGLLYAIGRRKGLYFLRPEVLLDQTKPEVRPAYAFNAVGHMTIDEELGQAYATSLSKDDEPDFYDQIAILNLRIEGEVESAAPPSQLLPLQDANGNVLTGDDGLELRPGGDGGEKARLYVVAGGVGASSSKGLLTYDRPIMPNTTRPKSRLAIENTNIALAYHTGRDVLLLSLEDSYRLQVVGPNGKNIRVSRIPVQIQPVDLAVDRESGQTYVLNFISNTVTAFPTIPAGGAQTTAFLQKLVAYRLAVLSAFVGLLGGILQYLKDCFCHHLLVKCPTCDDEKIYLACVEIKENKIYKICNFDKRKYVKSFPTVDYWMSMVPILPAIKWGFEKLCCMVMPDLFAKFGFDKAVQPVPVMTVSDVAFNNFQAADLRSGVRSFQRTDTKAVFRDQTKSAKLVGKLALDNALSLGETGRRPVAGVRKQALINTPVDDAVKELNKNNIEVERVVAYDPRKAGQNIGEFTSTPQRLEAGDRVVLYEKDGKVLFYSSQPAAVARVTIPKDVEAKLDRLEGRKTELADFASVLTQLNKVEARRTEVGSLDQVREDLSELEAERAAAKEQLSALKSEVAAVRKGRKAEAEQLNKLKQQRTEFSAELKKLDTAFKDVNVMHKKLRLDIARDRPVKGVQGVTPQIDKQLRELGIRTVEELSKATPTTLRGINGNTARALIKRAGTRLKQPNG